MWFLGDVKVAKSKYLNSADSSIEDSPLVFGGITLFKPGGRKDGFWGNPRVQI